jgi:hypothetical protein
MIEWCGTPVSNRRPSAWQADALPTELVPQSLLEAGYYIIKIPRIIMLITNL